MTNWYYQYQGIFFNGVTVSVCSTKPKVSEQSSLAFSMDSGLKGSAPVLTSSGNWGCGQPSCTLYVICFLNVLILFISTYTYIYIIYIYIFIYIVFFGGL